MNVMIPALLCLVGLSSAFSRIIVPWVQKGVLFFFLIPDSSQRGLFAKNAAE